MMPLEGHVIKRFPIVPVFVCLVVCAGFVKLGLWQVERLAWKNNLQDALAQVFDVDAARTPFDWQDLDSLPPDSMRRGFVDGRFDFSRALLLQGKLQYGRTVYPVLAPFTPQHYPSFVAVAGCIAHPDVDKVKALGGIDARLVGLAYTPSVSSFLPDNDLDKGALWRLDAPVLAAFWGFEGQTPAWVITAENAGEISGDFAVCDVPRDLPNNHLSYAIFWFALAALSPVLFFLRFGRGYLQST